MLQRQKIRINGIVQGVGFRPFVYRMARDCGLGGFIKNSCNGVLIEVEAEAEALAFFRERLKTDVPPIAQITEFSWEEIKPLGETEFSIQPSRHDTKALTLISPDISICEDCLQELSDSQNRRFRYPFINCTNCGPRYTIIHGIPYDRPNTSMGVFSMCRECDGEYHDPMNRRFHAQPNACPVCGPHPTLHKSSGEKIETGDPVGEMAGLLGEGSILAIRGLGGFHLAVDANNETAVLELRRRKGRAEKPFALMAPDLESIHKYCVVTPEEEKTLRHHTRPIVLLRTRLNCGPAPSVAPGNRYLGFMLPYTPLHYLILRDNFDALVMTSGNFSEEPIAMGNSEALDRLSGLADYFLLHDREILQRCDDSIVRVVAGKTRVLRRSRGYVPMPVFMPSPTQKTILACGGELKNTIALARDNTVFLSQHIGDLDNPASLVFFENSITHLQNILEITPEVIAYDLHPEYLSTKWARSRDGLPHIGVQHHHAHLVSVMVENEVEEPCIGIILDGTGYGTDGTLWGGEVLIGDASGFDRFAWLEPVALPGGTAAIRQPWRMALSYLYSSYGPDFLKFDLPFLLHRRREEITVILQMMEKGLNSPLTSSCGRLFDAVSALLNIRSEVRYEAQAAMELEVAVDESVRDSYNEVKVPNYTRGLLPVQPLFRSVVEDTRKGEIVGKIAARFHRSLAELFLKSAIGAREVTGISQVGLSGGVFQNVYFFTYLLNILREEGFAALTHKRVPSNDGGLALGQVAIANAELKKK